MRGPSLVAASGGHSSSLCAGLSLSRPLLLRSTGSRRAGSVVVAHRPSCSAACGILPDQGSNPRPLHRQADSQPLRHQGSPINPVLISTFNIGVLSEAIHQVLLCMTWRILPSEGYSPNPAFIYWWFSSSALPWPHVLYKITDTWNWKNVCVCVCVCVHNWLV